FCMANRTEFPPLGLMGGGPGRVREHRVNDVMVDPKGYYELASGDRITMVEAGGGGYGDPAERPRAAVLADLAEGFITPEGAARDYGMDHTE
ncbi:MAG: hydantoinase B/oxoprolinase family protein, partial [Alphaproteobacteria bacterium]|nr:hydantoinase B/oxoprolinase family protein [Alphaproteobacteria bacterium]